MNVVVQFLLDYRVGFFTSSPGSQDGVDLSKMNPATNLPSPPSAPFPLTPLSSPSLSCRDTRGQQVEVGCPLQPTPVLTSVFLFPGPLCKPKTCLKQLGTSVLASTPIAVAEDSGKGRFGVAPTEPDPVTDLTSPVLLVGKLTTQARASLVSLGRVPQGQCALAAALWALWFSTPELFQAALHSFPSKGLWNALLGLFTWLIVSSATPRWEAPPCRWLLWEAPEEKRARIARQSL